VKLCDYDLKVGQKEAKERMTTPIIYDTPADYRAAREAGGR
jgi:hypothetical protein